MAIVNLVLSLLPFLSVFTSLALLIQPPPPPPPLLSLLCLHICGRFLFLYFLVLILRQSSPPPPPFHTHTLLSLSLTQSLCLFPFLPRPHPAFLLYFSPFPTPHLSRLRSHCPFTIDTWVKVISQGCLLSIPNLSPRLHIFSQSRLYQYQMYVVCFLPSVPAILDCHLPTFNPQPSDPTGIF